MAAVLIGSAASARRPRSVVVAAAPANRPKPRREIRVLFMLFPSLSSAPQGALGCWSSGRAGCLLYATLPAWSSPALPFLATPLTPGLDPGMRGNQKASIDALLRHRL